MLEDKRIAELVKNEILVNATPDCIQPISVDLNIESIVYWELDEEKVNQTNPQGDREIQDSDILITYQTPYQLKPHETVFVKTKEGLKMPENLVGRILEKNSVMRLGLQVSGPLYQPTHQTAIFLRVTNLTEYIIELHKDFTIAQITFEDVVPPDIPYAKKENVQYMDEFIFKAPHNLINKSIKPEDKFAEQIKTVESKILTVFTIFMGAFVSSLALIVVNFNSFPKLESVKDIVLLNGSLAICIAVILLSVFRFYYKLTSQSQVEKTWKSVKNFTIRVKTYLCNLKFKKRHHKPTTIYLAACYREHERNQKLYDSLTAAGFHVFLPENLHLKESTEKLDQSKVFYSCYYKLSECEIVLVLYPFGRSVSAEIGYAIAKNKILVELKPKNINVDSECMIDPGFHFIVETEEELIKLLGNLLTP